jgi:hypothetical protein
MLSVTFANKRRFGLRLQAASLSFAFEQVPCIRQYVRVDISSTVFSSAFLKKPNPSALGLCLVCCSPIPLLGCKDDGIHKTNELRASLQILESD